MRKNRVARPKIEQPADSRIRHIALTQGKIAILDARGFERVSEFNWCAMRNTDGLYVVVRREKGRLIYLTSAILENRREDGRIHFRGRNRFDFRRANLRIGLLPRKPKISLHDRARARRPVLSQPADPDVRLIPLTQGQVAIVDACNYDRLNAWNWQAHFRHGLFYATSMIGGKTVQMARLLLDLKAGDKRLADHRDGKTLDCRLENLRVVTHAESNRNQKCRSSSGFKGVNRAGKRWRAAIHFDGSRIELGRFQSAELAARAYDRAARKNFGEFARLNFPRREVGAIETPSPAAEILEAIAPTRDDLR
jgi:HNH endonuclease